MAKLLSTDLPDPFDNDDLFDDPLDTPLSDLDSLKIDDIDEIDDDPERGQWRPSAARAPVSIGQIIGGTIQVILLAAVVLALCLGIAFALVFVGQWIGLVPARPVPGSTQVSALPTQAGQQATSAPEAAATTVAVALPSSTPDTGCPTAPAWWNSQQIQENYVYFTQTALEEARGSNNIAALLEQMRIRRSFVANYQAFDCVRVALDPLLRGFDATIEAARALNANDSAGFEQQQTNMNTAFADLTVALWTLGANADPNAPPALGVALNSGGSCGAQNWYDSVKPRVAAFYVAAEQIIPAGTTAATARTLFETMAAERANVAAVAAPTCATQAQTVLLAVLDNARQSIEEQFAGGSNPASAETIRQNIVFMAWLRWLGLS